MAKVNIRNKALGIPLIQGGMGIGVSLGNLAGHVMKEGGLGVISAAQTGYRELDFKSNTIEANLRALKQEIQSKLSDFNKTELFIKNSTASEAETLSLLWNYCYENNCNVLYLHSKGVTKPNHKKFSSEV
jgi:NAD(P)H-dependent flavin oxidoreductase YrpB (nitropropane dioxygenase family)